MPTNHRDRVLRRAISSFVVTTLLGTLALTLSGHFLTVGGATYLLISVIGAAIVARSRAGTSLVIAAVIASVVYGTGGTFAVIQFDMLKLPEPFRLPLHTVLFSGITYTIFAGATSSRIVRGALLAAGIAATLHCATGNVLTGAIQWNILAGAGLHGFAYLEGCNTRVLRLRAAGLCITCEYDRRGLPAGAPCPECGDSDTPPASDWRPVTRLPWQPDPSLVHAQQSWAEARARLPSLAAFAFSACIVGTGVNSAVFTLEPLLWFGRSLLFPALLIAAFAAAGRPRTSVLWLAVLCLLAWPGFLGLRNISSIPPLEASEFAAYLVWSLSLLGTGLALTRSSGWTIALMLAGTLRVPSYLEWPFPLSWLLEVVVLAAWALATRRARVNALSKRLIDNE